MTKKAAQRSTQFQNYLSQGDFVGADMARKYLQMGYTRARRYANYKGGKKYDAEKITPSWRVVPARKKKRKQPLSFTPAGKPPKPMSVTEQKS